MAELTSPVIVPGTHQMLFSTRQLNPLNLGITLFTSNDDLLLADIDTGAIKQLLAIGQGGNFLVSPDGKLVAVQAPDQIEVITTQGEIVFQAPFTYPEDDIYTTTIPMAWTQDSRELFVVPPISTSEIPSNRGYPLLRTIWRYSLDNNSGVEIRLDPPPVSYWLGMSPDGNWIVYSYELGYPGSVNWDAGKPVGIYLGNLQDGTSKLLYSPEIGASVAPYLVHYWLPDSTRFVLGDYGMGLYIGNFQGEITHLYRGGYFSWLDNRRYFYGGDSLGEIGKEEKFKVMEYPAGFELFKSQITLVFLEP